MRELKNLSSPGRAKLPLTRPTYSSSPRPRLTRQPLPPYFPLTLVQLTPSDCPGQPRTAPPPWYSNVFSADNKSLLHVRPPCQQQALCQQPKAVCRKSNRRRSGRVHLRVSAILSCHVFLSGLVWSGLVFSGLIYWELGRGYHALGRRAGLPASMRNSEKHGRGKGN